MCSDLSSPPSAPEDSYSSSRVSPPSISFLVALFLVFPPRTPASSLSPARPRASHGQNTSISVLPLVASMSYLLSSVLSLPVYAHLFSSQSRRPSAFSSRHPMVHNWPPTLTRKHEKIKISHTKISKLSEDK